MHYYAFVILKEELVNVKHFILYEITSANVVNVFIRILEFGLVARQPLLIHVATLSRLRALPFSGLFGY